MPAVQHENNINPLSTPALFNFDGFLRTGVGDPRQVQQGRAVAVLRRKDAELCVDSVAA